MFCEEPVIEPEKPICRCKHCILRKSDTVPWPEALEAEMPDKEQARDAERDQNHGQKRGSGQRQDQSDVGRRLSANTIPSSYSVVNSDDNKSKAANGNKTPPARQASTPTAEQEQLEEHEEPEQLEQHPQQRLQQPQQQPLQQQQPTILLIVVNKHNGGYPGQRQAGTPNRGYPGAYPTAPPRAPSNFYNQPSPPPPIYGGYERARYEQGYQNNPPPYGAPAPYPNDGRGPNPNNWYQYGNGNPGPSSYGQREQPQSIGSPHYGCHCPPSVRSPLQKRCGCKNETVNESNQRGNCRCEPPSTPSSTQASTPREKHMTRGEQLENGRIPLEIKKMGNYRCVSVPVCIAQGKPACCECCQCDHGGQDDEDDEEELSEYSSTCCCNNLDNCTCAGKPEQQTEPSCECTMTELERHLRQLMPNANCFCYVEKKKKRKKKKLPALKRYDRFANPPRILEPKSCYLDRCCTVCCHPVGKSCYKESYCPGCNRW